MSLSRHIRTHVVGYVAVFLALTGTAHALTGTNTVDSGDIVDSGVTTPDVRVNAVNDVKIANGTLGTVDLLDHGVKTADLKGGAVNADKVANGSLGPDEFVAGALHSRVTETCGGQAWRFFRLTESFFNCASPVHEVANTFQTNLPGWELVNGCRADDRPILSIESTENFATVNWFYRDGVTLHAGGTALGKSEKVVFNDGPIWGQFILSNPGNGSSVPVNAITITFGGATCSSKATAAVGLF